MQHSKFFLVSTGKYLDLVLRVFISASGRFLNHLLNLLCLADLRTHGVVLLWSWSVRDNMLALVNATLKLLYASPWIMWSPHRRTPPVVNFMFDFVLGFVVALEVVFEVVFVVVLWVVVVITIICPIRRVDLGVRRQELYGAGPPNQLVLMHIPRCLQA